jgi:hypothetical protein
MKSDILIKKFDEVIGLQDHLLVELRKVTSGQPVTSDIKEIANQIEEKYDIFKNLLLGEHNSQLTSFEFGRILPRYSYSYNQQNESIACLESWRRIHRKLFHL